MSKELQKFKKTFSALKTAGDKATSAYASHCTNRAHYSAMLTEAAREVGRAVQDAKNKGIKGSNIAAFASDAGVKSALSVGEDFIKQGKTAETVLKKILSDTNTAMSKLQALAKDMEKDIATRKKKSDRKVLKVSSDSLPDIEKLLVQVKALYTDLRDNITGMESGGHAWSAKALSDDYDKVLKAEIAKTKEDRNARDEREQDKRGFDMRLVNKHQTAFKKGVETIKTELADAESHYKNKDIDAAEKCFNTSISTLKTMAKIQEPYVREMKKKSRGQLRDMQHDKDGKTILAFVDMMEKAMPALQKLLKTRMRATL